MSETLLQRSAFVLRSEASQFPGTAHEKNLRELATSCEDAAKLIATLADVLNRVVIRLERLGSEETGPCAATAIARAALALARKELP